jgi:hypothetical protein
MRRANWRELPSQRPADRRRLAGRASNVWAVGENEEVPGLGISTLIEHWNGSAWSIAASPTPGAYPMLNAVAARGATDVYAVGSNEPSVNGGVEQGLILRWNGSSWSQDSDPTDGLVLTHG